MKTELDECNSRENPPSALPKGWKSEKHPKTNSKVIVSPNQKTFESYLSAFIYISENKHLFSDEELSTVRDKLEEEGWKSNDKLPVGWKISKDVGDNIFILLSREGKLFQTLESSQLFVSENSEYDESTAVLLEDLCMELLEEYLEEINVKRFAESSSTIITRGAKFTCNLCGQIFKKKSTFDAHSIFHKGFKPFQCKECFKSYNQKEGLDAHMKNHKEEIVKLYTCQVCSEKLYSLKTIVNHMNEKHPDFQPYNCERCGENFSRSELLRIHKKNHSELRVASCEICKKSFRTSFSLKRHRTMFH